MEMVVEDYVSAEHIHSTSMEAIRFDGKVIKLDNRNWYIVKPRNGQSSTEFLVVMTQKEPEKLFIIVRRRKAN